MIYPGVAATIGKTPLVELRRIGRETGVRLLAKLESRNPGGSVKDRIAAAMVDDAERAGLLRPGGTIVEATSGNTGIALAFVAATKGYRLIVTMPERMSKERLSLLRYLGAQVTLTPGTLMGEAVDRAQALRQATPGAVALDQFRNLANAEAHRQSTGPEIWADTDGAVDVFVSGVGTGGTITGVGEVLKSHKPSVKVVAVEPANAAVLSGKKPSNHLIQGIGAGFIPPLLNRAVIDEVVPISDQEAFAHARRLAREEGISAGISSGATLAAALRMAEQPHQRGQTIVFMVGDGGERYISGPLVNELLGSHP
ncbi:MAG TPA: cysteine synthase A [Polyangia bacterium]|jgi:cysteine synthase A|nr:cysteine synthase A [Polyangia bacterium]